MQYRPEEKHVKAMCKLLKKIRGNIEVDDESNLLLKNALLHTVFGILVMIFHSARLMVAP